MTKLAPGIFPTTIITFLLLTISFEGWSQQEPLVYNVTRTRHIYQSYYEEIKGSPYLYKEWYPAKLLDVDGKFHTFSKVNFNGFTHELETKSDGLTEEFISDSYVKIIVNTGTNNDIFVRSIHHELVPDIVCIIYDGQKVKFIKKFEVRLKETVVQTPGVPTKFEKFSPVTDYYIIIEDVLTKIKLKKKYVVEILEHKQEVEKYLKQEKINLNLESGLILLLKYYESLVNN